MTLTRSELERMTAEVGVCTDVTVAASIAAGRLSVLDPANDGDAILDDLDDPEAILAKLGLVAGDEVAEAYASGPTAWGRSRGWNARRVTAPTPSTVVFWERFGRRCSGDPTRATLPRVGGDSEPRAALGAAYRPRHLPRLAGPPLLLRRGDRPLGDRDLAA